MKKIRILHTGDFHLDSPLKNLGDAADICREELLRSFGTMVDIARESLVDAIVIAGDLFDNTNPSLQTVDYVCRKLKEISEIPVFIAKGNHDYKTDIEYPDNVRIFGTDTECYTVGDCNIYGKSFSSRYITECNIKNFKAGNDKINIFVLHADVVGQGGTSEYNPLTTTDMSKSNIDYFALGHVHKYSGLQKVNSTYYAYCGCPYGRGFDETGEKGVVIAEIEKNSVKTKFIPIAKRKYVQLECDISVCENMDDVIALVKNAITDKNDLYKIILKGETEFKIDEKMILRMLPSENFYVKIYNETSKKIDIESLAKENTLKGIFVKNAIDNPDALRYGLAALNGESI